MPRKTKARYLGGNAARSKREQRFGLNNLLKGSSDKENQPVRGNSGIGGGGLDGAHDKENGMMNTNILFSTCSRPLLSTLLITEKDPNVLQSAK